MPDNRELNPRPVDKLWPDRRQALTTYSCSIGHHPVDPNDPTWSSVDRREWEISGCCPRCWDEMFAPLTEDDADY